MGASELRAAAVRQDALVNGFALLRGASDDELATVLAAFGHVIHIEEVASEADTGSLVSSRHGLTPHTDHHAAHHIVWSCRQQADQGGDSLLVDGLELVRALPQHHQRALEAVVLTEHNIFEGDVDEHPMLTFVDGRLRLYYSYWLARGDMAGAAREAFDAFTRALQVVPQQRLRLRPGDVLVVDNHRMLHGRTPIIGTSPRLLLRYWLAPQPVEAAVQKTVRA